MSADLAAENATRELAKLTQEEKAIRDRIANDTARLAVIAAQKGALAPLTEKTGKPEGTTPKTK